MSILSVDNISPIGSGTSVTVNNAATLVVNNVSVSGVTTITGDTGNVRLDLHATASGTGSQIKLHNDHGTAYFGQAGDTSGDLLVYNESSTNIKFFTNGNNERLRIDSLGNIGMNTTTASDSTGNCRAYTFSRSDANGQVRLILKNIATGFGNGAGFHQGIDGANAFIENRTNGGYLDFTTNNSGSIDTRVRITAAGYVTKSNHPSFLAGRTGGNQTFTLGTFPFNVARINVGNHYSTSTYKFTAPVAGIYYFFAQVYYNNGNGHYRVGFRKTPSGGSAFMLNTAAHHMVGNDNSKFLSIIESMAVGDTVELYSDQNASIQCYYDINGTTYGAHTYIGGYLIG